MIVFPNEIIKIRVLLSPHVGDSLAYSLRNPDGSLLAAKTLNRIPNTDVFQAEHVFTEVGDYLGIVDDHKYIVLTYKVIEDKTHQNLKIINDGVKSASLLIPYTTDLNE